MHAQEYPDEIWKAIPGWEGFYSVSNIGRLRSEARSIVRRDGHPKSYKTRIMRPCASKGYYLLSLYKNGRGKRFFVHQLVLMAFVGPCPEGMECRHLNGSPGDNRLENLAWGTPKENGGDRIRHGTSKNQGGLVKLTLDDVREIRRRAALGEKPLKLSAAFDIHVSVIRGIVYGRTHKRYS